MNEANHSMNGSSTTGDADVTAPQLIEESGKATFWLRGLNLLPTDQLEN
jgi:hypothetical protein